MPPRGDALPAIIEAIKEVGPRNISEIARRTGLPVETVRYKVRNQLGRLGIKIRVNVNYGKLGLRRYWLNLYFTQKGKKIASRMLHALSGEGFLTYYARLLPGDYHVAIISLPPRLEKEYREFLDALVYSGILSDYNVWPLAWIRSPSMRSEHFDFVNRKWVVDWEELKRRKPSMEPIPLEDPNENVKIDEIDLLILKELQKDAFQQLTEIARKIKCNPKTVRYHFLEHIQKRKLINRYIIRWTSKDKKEAIWVYFTLIGPSYDDLITAERCFMSLPFTSLDTTSINRDLYIAGVGVPIEYYFDTIKFVVDALTLDSAGADIGIVDIQNQESFTLPVQAFNAEEGRWVLKSEFLENVLKKYRLLFGAVNLKWECLSRYFLPL